MQSSRASMTIELLSSLEHKLVAFVPELTRIPQPYLVIKLEDRNLKALEGSTQQQNAKQEDNAHRNQTQLQQQNANFKGSADVFEVLQIGLDCVGGKVWQ